MKEIAESQAPGDVERPCVYDEPWPGEGRRRCRRPGTGDPSICDKHAMKRCWCGKKAISGCSIALISMCGQPLCSEHQCYVQGPGIAGLLPHSKDGVAQFEVWYAEQESKA